MECQGEDARETSRAIEGKRNIIELLGWWFAQLKSDEQTKGIFGVTGWYLSLGTFTNPPKLGRGGGSAG